jgi:hypothetical protein
VPFLFDKILVTSYVFDTPLVGPLCLGTSSESFYALTNILSVAQDVTSDVTRLLCCLCASFKEEEWNHCLQAAPATRLCTPHPSPTTAAVPSSSPFLSYPTQEQENKRKWFKVFLTTLLPHVWEEPFFDR